MSNNQQVIEHRRQKKRRAVELKGGGCEICGYDRSMRSLVFHHRDEAAKAFGLSARGMCYSWESILEELEKCILLCANCHGEVHDGTLEIGR